MKAQICILANTLCSIGGIETFVYNWCSLMKDTYDIVVAVASIADEQYNRLKRIVRVVENTEHIECDTVVVMHIATKIIPSNIKYNKKIQMVHGCKSIAYSNIGDCDVLVPVSETASKSFGNEIKDKNVEVILNPMKVSKPNKILKLVSATRLTQEKGGDRILKLAKQLRDKNIPFIWYVFSNLRLIKSKHKKDEYSGIIEMPATLDISSWIKECDYLVQLSDTESFGYSIVESLMLGVPVIVTPLDVLDEIGVKDGVNGYVVPFDMKDIDVDKIYNSDLKFEYNYDNKLIANKWCKILGDPKPFVKYNYKEVNMWIKATKNIYYAVEDINAVKGAYYEVSEERAKVIVKGGAAVYATEDELIKAGKVKPVEKKVKEEVVEVAMPTEEIEKATVKKTVAKKTSAKKPTTKKSK